ncbi:MAG: hypothetical protein U0230_02635 [Polyangiales bacterium]
MRGPSRPDLGPLLAAALTLPVAMGACRDDAAEIEAAQRAAHTGSMPPTAVGGGLDPASGLPVGYPPDVPLVPGAEAVSGGVDPGVVRTALLRYRMPQAAFVEALVRALEEASFRIVDRHASSTGAVHLRAEKGDRGVSFVVADENGTTRVDVVSRDVAPPGTGTDSRPR